jgi:hypothetical protein
VNLSIAVTAKEMNPGLFTVLRQNTQASTALFEAFQADITMVPSQIVANSCLAELRTPWLTQFLAEIRRQDNAWAESLLEQLGSLLGSRTPALWRVRLEPAFAPALALAMTGSIDVPVGMLTLNPDDRTHRLPALALGLARQGQFRALPDADERLELGDELLFAGAASARRAQAFLLSDPGDCSYVLGQ